MPQAVDCSRYDQLNPSPLDTMRWKRIATHTGATDRPPTKIAQSQHRDLTVAGATPYRTSFAARNKYSLPSLLPPTSLPVQSIHQLGHLSSSSMRSLSMTPIGEQTLKIRKTRSTKALQPASGGSCSAKVSELALPSTGPKDEVYGAYSALCSVDEIASLSSSSLSRRVGGPRQMREIPSPAEKSALSGASSIPALSLPPQTQSAPRRRPSVKKRVLSKVMGSLQNNQKAAPRLRNGQCEGSLFRRLSVHNNSASKSRTTSSDVSSLSSQSRDSYCLAKRTSHR